MRRAAFLAEMERLVPWQELCALIAPVYRRAGKNRLAVGLERDPVGQGFPNWRRPDDRPLDRHFQAAL